jgi:hypothetical protein
MDACLRTHDVSVSQRMSRLTPLVIPAAVIPDSDRGEDPLGSRKVEEGGGGKMREEKEKGVEEREREKKRGVAEVKGK